MAKPEIASTDSRDDFSMKNTPNHKTKSMNIVLDVLMIDHLTDISKDCHQTSQIFAQVAVVLNLDGTEWTTEWAPFLRLAISVLTTLNWRDPVALNKCFDSSTDDQIDVFGNVFFNYRTIGSHTCDKKATHIPVSILIISRLNSHNLSTNWVVTAEDVLSLSCPFCRVSLRTFPSVCK